MLFFLRSGARAAGKFYLFTMASVRPPSRYKTVDEVGRQGFYDAIKAAYANVLPTEHACHGGPQYAVVVRELHRHSPLFRCCMPHLHAACAFSSHHRWRAVEEHLREVLLIKARREESSAYDWKHRLSIFLKVVAVSYSNLRGQYSPFTKQNGQFWGAKWRFP